MVTIVTDRDFFFFYTIGIKELKVSKRQIIEIDQDKCVGCGLCITGCHQGAIKLIDGKATLMSESYCDGLGMCLPKCPTGAIKLVEKEAESFDQTRKDFALKGGGCPGSAQKSFKPLDTKKETSTREVSSRLNQWPVQLRLINPDAPFLDGANLLISADCCAYAYGNFHEDFMKNKITIIACPKLDETESYIEKLADIFTHKDINSITVTRMSVPCCGGLPRLVKEALERSGKVIPYAEITLKEDGTR